MTVPTPVSEDRLFPALTAMQEAFVVNYATNGGKGSRAAVDAGYSKTSAAVLACRMLTDPKICAAIMQLCTAQQATMVPRAQGVIATLMQKAKSEYVQLEAAKDVLTRAGLNAPQRVAVAGAVNISIDLGE